MSEGHETRGIEERLKSAREILRFALDNMDQRGIKNKLAECGLSSEELKPILREYFIPYAFKTSIFSANELLDSAGISLEDLLTNCPEYQIHLVGFLFMRLGTGGVADAMIFKDQLETIGYPLTETQLNDETARLIVEGAMERALSKGSASDARVIAKGFNLEAELRHNVNYRKVASNYLISARNKDPQMFDRVFSKYQGIFDFDTSFLVALEQGVLTTSDIENVLSF